MSRVGIFLADGFEEIEGLTVVDILRRAGIDISMISINGKKKVTGAHGIALDTDEDIVQCDPDKLDMLVLPGGMPGTTNLAACEKLTEALKKADQEKRGIAAICAAPSVLGDLGFLKGKKAVLVLSGGNMDVITMSSVVQLGLIQRDRIFTVSVLLPDKAGELVRVATVIANEQGNVIKLDHNQFVSTNRNAAVELKITLEAFGTDHKERIVNALKEHGYNPKVIRPNL